MTDDEHATHTFRLRNLRCDRTDRICSTRRRRAGSGPPAHGTLIWGADQEGGGPYVYPDPKQDGHVIGFEVEVAECIARQLGVK